VLAGTFSTMLSKSPENVHLYLVFDLRGKVLSFITKYNISYRFFVDVIKLKKFPSIPVFLLVFILKKCENFLHLLIQPGDFSSLT